MTTTIWHNPACGTSRNALAALREAGHDPQVIDYQRTGWNREELKALLAEAGLTPGEALRHRGTPADELGLTQPGVTDDAILDAMVAYPILVERPLVRTTKGACLARPVDRLQGLL